MRFPKEQTDLRQTLCPRCGEMVDYHLLDEETNRVEILCPDCGRFEMTQEDFDQVASDISEQEDRR